MRNDVIKRVTLSFALILIVLFAVTFGISISDIAFAADQNVIYFEATEYMLTTNILYARVIIEGTPNTTVSFSYRTISETAIDGVDYVGANKTVSKKIGADGTGFIDIGINCSMSPEQKISVYNYNGNYGRHFYIKLIDADNAVIDENRDTCKCFLKSNYNVEGTLGILNTTIGGTKETAYFEDYNVFLSKDYDKKVLDGKKTFKSWNSGMQFNDYPAVATWYNRYISQGIADAYGSYIIDYIDNEDFHSSTDIYILAGNNEFISNYKEVKRDIPGMYLYLGIEPVRSGAGLFSNAEELNGRGQYLIAQGSNPKDENDNWVLVNSNVHAATNLQYYWIQSGDKWYALDGQLTYSQFYKLEPYGGNVEHGLIVWNKNKEINIEFKKLYMFMALIDTRKPQIVEEWIDDSSLIEDGKLRLCIRFNEPVYLSKTNSSYARQDLQFFVNNLNTPYYASYVSGNYSDTLVYEIDGENLPKKNITSIRYYVPEDICDMAYWIDEYKNAKNNSIEIERDEQGYALSRNMNFLNGTINYYKPDLSIDKPYSGEEKNIYNLMLSLNADETAEGTIYYEWSTSNSKDDYMNPARYRYSYTLAEEDSGSMALTLHKDEATGITSGTYYLHALAVSKYNLKDYDCFGPYKLDGEPPRVTIQTTSNEFKTKVFELNNEKTVGAGLYNVTAIVSWTNENGDQTATYKVMDAGVRKPGFAELSDTRYQYTTNVENEGDFIREIMDGSNRLDCKISFDVEDSAGNKSKTNTLRVVYDTRDVFAVNTNFPAAQGYELIDDVVTLYNAYDISTVERGDNKGIVFTVDSGDQSQVVAGETEYKVVINGDKVYEASSSDIYSVIVGDLEPGFYEAIPIIVGELSGQIIDLVSNPICFYLTNGKDDESINRTTSLDSVVLTNKVFQIEDARYYYLDQAGNTISSHLYGATYNSIYNLYEGGSSSPTFSTSIEAKKYIKYMEYQDLYLVQITANMASLLNTDSGSTTYMKATGETVVAQEGQLWIRYKRNTWTTNSTTYGWAYYYYGSASSDLEININGLSQNLSNAINTVVNRIVSAGESIYLVQDWQINQTTGAPYLADEQIHKEAEEATVTKTGISYVVNPTYEGDSTIYKNTIKVNDVDYPLATNLQFVVGDNQEFFYKFGESTEWTSINVTNGQLLRDILGVTGSGVYTIREYGNFGVCEYSIYYDKQLPTLDVLINDIPQTLDGTVLNLSGVKASLVELRNEADDLAFVAIYTYPSKVLQTVLYKNDIPGYMLSGGNYYVQVGDRAGNIVTYRLLLSTSQLEVTATENESGSAIIVRVNNRDDSEIYSYEVFLNEELIDADYAAVKSYKDPGVYRIIVRDIYGSSETISLQHDYQTPQMTWYYLNAYGSYSQYDEDHIVRMIISEDASSSRVTNIYTSTLIRLRFDLNYYDSDIEFEMLDLEPGMYSYSSTTGVLSVNELTGWRLRVWFKDHPEFDHIYSCQIDADAPSFDGTFVGTSFSYPYGVETMTQEELEAIGIGNMIIPEDLTYVTFETETKSFSNGDVIEGNHISIMISDTSGIKTFTVKRNGQVIDMELDSSNALLINSYGEYEITATDSLGNTSTFVFNNTKDPIATATMGNEVLVRDETYIGHDDVIISTKYVAYTQFLFRTSERNYPFVFQFDGHTLTYGSYFVGIEYDEEDPTLFSYETDYITAAGFRLSLLDDNIQLNRWYKAYENDIFIIYAMFDSDERVMYRIESLGEEVSFTSISSVGVGKIPVEFNAILSQVHTDITIYSDNQPAEIVEGQEFIFVAGTVSLRLSSMGSYSPRVVRIDYAFNSEDAIFSNYQTIYWQDASHDIFNELEGEELGYYQIVVYNMYGNITTYTIRKVNTFQSIVTARYQDGSERVYYEDHDRWIYSNSEISLLVFNTGVFFEVNGEIYDGIITRTTTELVLNTFGTFDVRVVAANGIYESFKFELGMNSDFELDEDWITGYNMSALLHDQGYTNTRLTISEDAITAGVQYIDYLYNGELVVPLYDALGEDTITDLSKLENCIGKDGAGSYLIRFKDKYGDTVEKMVHYKAQPNYTISRMILGEEEWEPIAPGWVLIGIRSNYKVKFETTSSIYEFKVNGNITSLDEPKILEYGTSGNGAFEYTLSFLDEYGNYLLIRVLFSRQDLEIDKSKIKEVVVEDTLYTRSNVVITYASFYFGYVSINGADYISYSSGKTFYKDGTYAFYFEDLYGNRLSYTVVHKSYNQYTLTNKSTEQEIIPGSVLNNTSVNFRATDGSTIKTVVKNGNTIKDYVSNAFSETGHWELLIEDQVGNQSYVDFWIINNSLGEFTYIPPYGYEVSEIWLQEKSGDTKSLTVDKERVYLNKNGDYVILISGTEISQSFRFTITIDNTPPSATLEGVENGGTTPRDVSIKGLKAGDIVKIYKDGELIETIDVSLATEVPTITSGGDYKVVITNIQGISTEYNFTRKKIANAATSIFLIVLAVLIMGGIAIGLFYHTRHKTDA